MSAVGQELRLGVCPLARSAEGDDRGAHFAEREFEPRLSRAERNARLRCDWGPKSGARKQLAQLRSGMVTQARTLA